MYGDFWNVIVQNIVIKDSYFYFYFYTSFNAFNDLWHAEEENDKNLQEFLRTGFDTLQPILFLPSFPASWTPSCAKRRQSSPPLSPFSWWHMTYILSYNNKKQKPLNQVTKKMMFWLLHASVHPSQQELQLHHEASRVLIILKMNIFISSQPTDQLSDWEFSDLFTNHIFLLETPIL